MVHLDLQDLQEIRDLLDLQDLRDLRDLQDLQDLQELRARMDKTVQPDLLESLAGMALRAYLALMAHQERKALEATRAT